MIKTVSCYCQIRWFRLIFIRGIHSLVMESCVKWYCFPCIKMILRFMLFKGTRHLYTSNIHFRHYNYTPFTKHYIKKSVSTFKFASHLNKFYWIREKLIFSDIVQISRQNEMIIKSVMQKSGFKLVDLGIHVLSIWKHAMTIPLQLKMTVCIA